MTLEEILAQLLPQASAGVQPGVMAAVTDATPPPDGSQPSSIAVAPPIAPTPRQTEQSSIAGGMPIQQISDQPQIGTAYAPPSPSATGSVTTGSLPSPTAAVRPAPTLGLPERQRRGFGETVGGFFAGLSGPDSLAAFNQRSDKARDRDTLRYAQNQTFQALIKKGVDEDTARAAMVTPELQQQLIKSLWGGGETDDLKEYNYDIKQRRERGETDIPTLSQWMRQTKRTNALSWRDTGTELVATDPTTGEVVQRMPKDLAGVAQQKALGTAHGEAQAGLPRAVETATNMLQQIDGVLNSEALDRSVGPADQFRPSMSEGATDFDARLAQLKGQGFLQAFQSLKGGGAITEVEGQKATDAIGRLSRAQDERTFRMALQDLRDVVTRGLARSQAQAGGDFSGATIPGSEITRGGAAPGAAAGGGWSARRVN